MWSRTNQEFGTLEEAIAYCRRHGLAYEVSYPKYRYHQSKNYANNFKWKGHPKADEDDIA